MKYGKHPAQYLVASYSHMKVKCSQGQVMVGQLSSPRLLCISGFLWLSLQFSF